MPTPEEMVAALLHPQTVPEAPSTLMLQRQQLMAGQRPAQMFPMGQRELPVPQGFGRAATHSGDVFHFNPAMISPQQIQSASIVGRENNILGLGPFNKMDIAARNEPHIAVVERSPDGSEVKAAMGTPSTAPVQVAEFLKVKSPGHNVGIEDVHHVLMRRIKGH